MAAASLPAGVISALVASARYERRRMLPYLDAAAAAAVAAQRTASRWAAAWRVPTTDDCTRGMLCSTCRAAAPRRDGDGVAPKSNLALKRERARGWQVPGATDAKTSNNAHSRLTSIIPLSIAILGFTHITASLSALSSCHCARARGRPILGPRFHTLASTTLRKKAAPTASLRNGSSSLIHQRTTHCAQAACGREYALTCFARAPLSLTLFDAITPCRDSRVSAWPRRPTALQ